MTLTRSSRSTTRKSSWIQLGFGTEGITGGGVYHGHEGIRTWFREWNEAWEDSGFELQELIEAGQQVVSVVTRRARGRASGIDVQQPGAVVWTVREGKIVRVVWFPTREEAREAVGLRE